jgi:hypothetical protein
MAGAEVGGSFLATDRATDGNTENWEMNAAANSRKHACLAAALGLFALSALTGCQVDVSGQTLPSPYWFSDDVQYFPAGPEFKLSREVTRMQEMEAATAVPGGPGGQLGPAPGAGGAPVGPAVGGAVPIVP